MQVGVGGNIFLKYAIPFKTCLKKQTLDGESISAESSSVVNNSMEVEMGNSECYLVIINSNNVSIVINTVGFSSLVLIYL